MDLVPEKFERTLLKTSGSKICAFTVGFAAACDRRAAEARVCNSPPIGVASKIWSFALG
jgi:hypothetical protein